jgi:GNAT superfamily N-acetyltransferase
LGLDLCPVTTEADHKELQDQIRKIWPEVFIPVLGEDQVAYMLEHYQSTAVIRAQIAGGAQYFLLRYDDRICGYLAWERQGDALFLSKIYLAQWARGLGLFNQIFQACIAHAQRLGLQRLTLHVNRYNSQAVAVYLHKGFVITNEVDEPFGDYYLNDYHMQLQL